MTCISLGSQKNQTELGKVSLIFDTGSLFGLMVSLNINCIECGATQESQLAVRVRRRSYATTLP